MVKAFLVFALALFFTARLRAQSPISDWQTTAGGKMSFEVASVKQNNAGFYPVGPLNQSNFPLFDSDADPSTGGLFSVTNFPLEGLITFAYKLLSSDEIKARPQLPKWALAKGFDIQARAPGNPTRVQFRLVVQSLLAERFGFAMHYEVQQGRINYMVLARPGKLGPQLRAFGDEAPCASESAAIQTVAGGFPASCGKLEVLKSSEPGHLIRFAARKVTMATIADSLPLMARIGELNGPVIDKTGLTGNFDFILEFDRRPVNANPSDTTGVTLIEALKQQLGLKLDLQIGPVSTFVIDHIEPPSPN